MRGFIHNFDMKNLSLESDQFSLTSKWLYSIAQFKTFYLVNKNNSIKILSFLLDIFARFAKVF